MSGEKRYWKNLLSHLKWTGKMILRKGNIWDVWDDANLVCITTNSVIKSNGELVMGKGIALEAKNKMPGLPIIAGDLVHYFGNRYGFIYVPLHPPIGLFQTKYHYSGKSDIELIRFSVSKLIDFITDDLYCNAFESINLNFPGINNGMLARDVVLPIISKLPDIVHVWEK